MNELTISLNDTTPGGFTAWLEDYKFKASFNPHLSNNRSYNVQQPRLSQKKGLSSNQIHFTIEALGVITRDGVMKNNSSIVTVCLEPLIPGRNSIEIACIQLMPIGKRLKVKIEYENEITFIPGIFRMLAAIEQDWPETKNSIHNHVIGVAKEHGLTVKPNASMEEMEEQEIITGEPYSTDSTNQEKNKKKPKRDALKRAAYAFILLEDQSFKKRSDAAKRAKTTTTTMNKYEHHPDLKEMIKFFSDPHELNKYRQEIAKQQSKRNT